MLHPTTSGRSTNFAIREISLWKEKANNRHS
jgi:hypothetical protein